jgi:hypothetical protein
VDIQVRFGLLSEFLNEINPEAIFDVLMKEIEI